MNGVKNEPVESIEPLKSYWSNPPDMDAFTDEPIL